MSWFDILKKEVEFKNIRPSFNPSMSTKHGGKFQRHEDTEGYLLKDSVWKDEAGLEIYDGWPTIEEIEEIIGRRLTKEDFQLDMPATWRMPEKKPTVMSRIGNEGIIEGIKKFLLDSSNRDWIISSNSYVNSRQDGLALVRWRQRVNYALKQIGVDPAPYMNMGMFENLEEYGHYGETQ